MTYELNGMVAPSMVFDRQLKELHIKVVD